MHFSRMRTARMCIVRGGGRCCDLVPGEGDVVTWSWRVGREGGVVTCSQEREGGVVTCSQEREGGVVTCSQEREGGVVTWSGGREVLSRGREVLSGGGGRCCPGGGGVVRGWCCCDLVLGGGVVTFGVARLPFSGS